MSDPLASGREEADLDVEAMARLAAGDDLALNGIIDRWKVRLSSYLLRFTGNEAVALDLAEETFVRLYQTRARFRHGSPFATWLFGIAANLARNHLRWKGRHPTLSLEEADSVSSGGDPGEDALSRERAEAVRLAIASLPPDLREALILSEYEGFSHAEIAAVAGCSVKAVERRVAKARELLRGDLTRYFKG